MDIRYLFFGDFWRLVGIFIYLFINSGIFRGLPQRASALLGWMLQVITFHSQKHLYNVCDCTLYSHNSSMNPYHHFFCICYLLILASEVKTKRELSKGNFRLFQEKNIWILWRKSLSLPRRCWNLCWSWWRRFNFGFDLRRRRQLPAQLCRAQHVRWRQRGDRARHSSHHSCRQTQRIIFFS